MNKRSSFLKLIYEDTLILFLKNNHFLCYGFDEVLFSFFDCDLSLIRKHHVSYLIIDNMKIISAYYSLDNRYFLYRLLLQVLRNYDGQLLLMNQNLEFDSCKKIQAL